MKKVNIDKEIKKQTEHSETQITRKEALRKTGYYAISAATTLILLGAPGNAKAGPSASEPGPPPSAW